MDDALKKEFVPKLRELGFKGSYPHLRKKGKECVEIIGVQFSQWGPQFYIEIAKGPIEGVDIINGKHVEANKLKHYHPGKRMRVGDLPFDYSGKNFQEIAAKASTTIEEITAWFEAKDS